MKVKRGHNATYSLTRILHTVVFAGRFKSTLRIGFKELHSEIKTLTLSTATRVLRKIAWEDAKQWFHDFSGDAYAHARRRYNLRRPVDLSIDMKDVSRQKPRERDRNGRKKKRCIEDFEKTVRCKSRNGTNNAHRFVTAKVINKGIDFTCALAPIFKKTDKVAMLEEVIRNAKNAVRRIRLCLVDSYFFKSFYINSLNASGFSWVMSACWNRKVKRIVKQVKKEGKEWFVTPYTMNKGKWNEARFWLVVVRKPKSKEKKSGRLDEEYFAYATNIKVESRTLAFYLAEYYRARWQIETSHRVMNEFRARTNSTYYNVRFLTVAIAFAMYDAWILIKAMISAFGEYVEVWDMKKEIADMILAALAEDEFWYVV